MVAFGVRNFENLEKGLAEILRVLKPGGQLVILEFSKPKQPVRSFYNLYMGIVAPQLARWFKQNKEAINICVNQPMLFRTASILLKF